MKPNQFLGALVLVFLCVVLLSWMFSMMVHQEAIIPPEPVREETVIVEVDAPENVRCFVMVSRITNEPEDLSCVTNTTRTQPIFGNLPSSSPTLKF